MRREKKSSTLRGNASGTTTTTWCSVSACCAKGDQSLPVLAEVKALVKLLNDSPGRLLPGVKIQPY